MVTGAERTRRTCVEAPTIARRVIVYQEAAAGPAEDFGRADCEDCVRSGEATTGPREPAERVS